MAKNQDTRPPMTPGEYEAAFSISPQSPATPSDLLKQAHSIALDIRKFEIEQYWKRASYFWTLIGATFVAYLAVLNAERMEHKPIISFAIANIGLVLTFAWFLANRGSKFWQENWENHVALLENKVCGPLYKITVERGGNPNFVDSIFTAPVPYSSSKINQWIGVFIIIVWLVLAIIVVPKFNCHSPISFSRFGIGSMSVLVIAMMLKFGQSHRTDQGYKAYLRKCEI